MTRKRFYLLTAIFAVLGTAVIAGINNGHARISPSILSLFSFHDDYEVIDGQPARIRWDERPEPAQLLSSSYPEAKAWFDQARQQPIKTDVFWEAVMQRATPHWYGTRWDYNGTTRNPGQGKIACGYLLTTILQDVGFDLPRAKLAQLPSEAMIRRLVSKQHIRHFLNMSHEDFIRKQKAWGPGVYIIGMDNHTGFLWNDGKELFFIHSSWWPRNSTMKEIALWSPGLASTKYRVVGKLSADPQLFLAWKKQRKVGY